MINGPAAAPSKVRRPSGKRARVRRALRRIDKVFPARKYRQYVNMAQGTNRTKHGRKITIKARVKPKKAGITVEWILDTPKAGRTNRRGLSPAQRPFLSDVSSTTDDKGVAEVTLTLSLCGGDRFRVGARTKGRKKYKKYSGWFHVWRKLWFEIDTMKERGGGTLEMNDYKLPAVYEPCFVELKKQGRDNHPDNKWNIETGDLHDFANDYFGADKSPFQAHEVAIDHQADPDEDKLAITMNAPVYKTGVLDSYFVYGGGDSWLRSAKYNDGSGWKNLDKRKVSLIGSDKVYKQIRVDLSKGPVVPSRARPVPIELEFLRSKEWSGDGGSKPHSMIAMGYWYDTETKAEAKKRTVGTMAHELGHCLGMVPTTSSTYIDTRTGHHCSDPNCVMFATNTSTRGNKFCDVCKEELRKADFTKYKSSFMHTKGSKA